MFSSDLVVAGAIFLVLVTVVAVYSNQVANSTVLIEEDAERDEAALTAAKALVYSPGKPSNWEALGGINGVSSIGIAKERNVIDPGKLQRLVDLNQGNYSEVKGLLGLSRFNVKVSVISLEDKGVLEEFGLEPGPDNEVSSATRFAVYEGRQVMLRTRVFR